MRKLFSMSFGACLLFFSFSISAQQTFSFEGFEITFGTQDSIFQIADPIPVTLLIKNVSNSSKKFYHDVDISISKIVGDSQQVIMQPNFKFDPIIYKYDPDFKPIICGYDLRNRKPTKQEIKQFKDKKRGYTKVVPKDGFNSDFRIEQYYYDEDLNVFYDFGEGVGKKTLYAMKPAKYKIDLNLVIGKNKKIFSKQIQFRVSEIIKAEKEEFLDFVKSVKFHETLFKTKANIIQPYSTEDSTIAWFLKKHPNGKFRKRLLSFVIHVHSNNEYENAYRHLYLLELLKKTVFEFQITNNQISSALWTLSSIQNVGLIEDWREYLDEWMSSIETSNPILFQQTLSIKDQILKAHGGN